VSQSVSKMRMSVGVVMVLLLAMGCGGDEPSSNGGEGSPESALIAQGEDLFGERCAACHGNDLMGTTVGPPFLDPIYAPNHHPDEAFYSAVANGVQPHHWDFGAMPPQPSVTEDEVRAIIAFVRAEQQEAGITEDPNH
jgi:mono/diheme cytochrome c family protein